MREYKRIIIMVASYDRLFFFFLMHYFEAEDWVFECSCFPSLPVAITIQRHCTSSSKYQKFLPPR